MSDPRPPGDWRVEVIGELAAAVHDRETWMVEALGDAYSYRLLAIAAIHRLHERERELERLKQAHQRLNDQFRHVCARTAREVSAA